MASGMTWVFTLIAAAVVVAIALVARRLRSGVWAAVLGAVLGGTLGNLFDRLFRPPAFAEGHVVDFISTPWLMPAIYNVADIAIVGGMIAFVALTLFDVRLDGSRGRDADAAAEAADGGEPAAADDDGPAAAPDDDRTTSGAPDGAAAEAGAADAATGAPEPEPRA